MKKFVLLLVLCIISNLSVSAKPKDYAKIHAQEMNKAQKYSATKRYYADFSNDNTTKKVNVKDPKLIHLGGYSSISSNNINAKKEADNLQYSKIKSALCKKKNDDYNVQAYGEDFYKVYRIAEKIIRANKLDYMNWRILFAKDNTFNAASTDTNCIIINAGAYDSLSTNEDALAFLIGHEIAHSVLGHQVRIAKYLTELNRLSEDCIYYSVLLQQYRSSSKKMEYAADTEGAVFALRAGYDLSKAKEALSFIYTQDVGREYSYTHPTGKHRLENYAEVQKYFMEDDLVKQGVYNIYQSKVLQPRLSSDRKSLIIERNGSKAESEVYQTESPVNFYTRYAYKSYLYGEFKDAENYFNKLIELDNDNYIAYLYLSYTEEYLYKSTGKAKYLENAKAYANRAKELAPSNKYVKEQVEAL